MLADDLEELNQVLFGQLVRFVNTGLVDRILNVFYAVNPVSSTMSQLEIRIPSGIGAIREGWKGNKTRPVEDGIILSDGSVITASIKVRQCAKNSQGGNLSELKPIIRLLNRNEEQWAYIAEYSYSFYPNTESENARGLQYFRYDFHPEVLGDGDLGSHPYFHLHRDFDDEDDNEEDEENRFTTGLVHLSDVMSLCERKLFPDERQERLEEHFRAGEFDVLALDLAPSGFNSFITTLYANKRSWSKFKHKSAFEGFVKRKGWKLSNLENYSSATRSKRR